MAWTIRTRKKADDFDSPALQRRDMRATQNSPAPARDQRSDDGDTLYHHRGQRPAGRSGNERAAAVPAINGRAIKICSIMSDEL